MRVALAAALLVGCAAQSPFMAMAPPAAPGMPPLDMQNMMQFYKMQGAAAGNATDGLNASTPETASAPVPPPTGPNTPWFSPYYEKMPTAAGAGPETLIAYVEFEEFIARKYTDLIMKYQAAMANRRAASKIIKNSPGANDPDKAGRSLEEDDGSDMQGMGMQNMQGMGMGMGMQGMGMQGMGMQGMGMGMQGMDMGMGMGMNMEEDDEDDESADDSFDSAGDDADADGDEQQGDDDQADEDAEDYASANADDFDMADDEEIDGEVSLLQEDGPNVAGAAKALLMPPQEPAIAIAMQHIDMFTAIKIRMYMTVYAAADLQKEFFQNRAVQLRLYSDMATGVDVAPLSQIVYLQMFKTYLSTSKISKSFEMVSTWSTWLEDELDAVRDKMGDKSSGGAEDKELAQDKLFAFKAYSSYAYLDMCEYMITTYMEYYISSMMEQPMGAFYTNPGPMVATEPLTSGVPAASFLETESTTNTNTNTQSKFIPTMLAGYGYMTHDNQMSYYAEKLYRMYFLYYQFAAAQSGLGSAIAHKCTLKHCKGDKAKKMSQALFVNGFAANLIFASDIQLAQAAWELYNIVMPVFKKFVYEFGWVTKKDMHMATQAQAAAMAGATPPAM